MKYELTIKIISPTLLEIHWPTRIEKSILLDMIRVKEYLLDQWKTRLYGITSGFHVLGLQFKSRIDPKKMISHLEENLPNASQTSLTNRKRWEIPVCYDLQFAKDLKALAHSKQLQMEEVIDYHSQGEYLLHFYGFLPGFMYLGGLNSKLHTTRKTVPDRKIEKGSVAIGGRQTGIYPMESPGGWHVIGKTPITVFDPQSNLFPPFHPGDEIRFIPINLGLFYSIAEQKDFSIKNKRIYGED